MSDSTDIHAKVQARIKTDDGRYGWLRIVLAATADDPPQIEWDPAPPVLPHLGTFRWRRADLAALPARVAELARGHARGRVAVDLGEATPWGEIRYGGPPACGWEIEPADGSLRIGPGV